MPALAQRLRCVRSTETGLRCAARINLHQLPTSVLSFVGQRFDESSPSGIIDTFGKHATCQSFNIQILDRDQTKHQHQPGCQLVMKVRALVSDVSVRSLQFTYSLAPTVAAALATCHLALRSAQLGLCMPKVTRVFNLCAVRQGSELFEANVHANACSRWWQQLWFTLDRKANVPTPLFPLHRDGLDVSFNRTVQFDLHLSDALQAEFFVVKQTAAVAVRRERQGVETSVRLEAGESGTLATLHASEKSLERLINSAKHVLTRGEVGKAQIAVRANLFQLIRLHVVIDAFTVNAPRIAPLLDASVVQTTRLAKLMIHRLNLVACRIESVLESLSQYVVNQYRLAILGAKDDCVLERVNRSGILSVSRINHDADTITVLDILQASNTPIWGVGRVETAA